MSSEPEPYVYKTDEPALAHFLAMQESRIVGDDNHPEEAMFFALRLAAAGKAGGRFLDVGSAYGRFVLEMLPYAGSVTALEPDTQRYERCASTFASDARVEVLNTVTDAYRTRFPECKFDFILVSQVIQHLSTHRCAQLLGDVRALLAPGGIALLTTTHLYEERFRYENDSFTPRSLPDFDRYADLISAQDQGLPVRFFSKQTFLQALSAADLDLVAWQQFVFFRPDHVQDFARMIDAPIARMRDNAINQLAIVR